MATRRPASSRSRVNNNLAIIPPVSQPRSRSAMARSASTTRFGDDQNNREQPVTLSTLKHSRNPSQQEVSESNIQVVVRCRQRSEREILDNSPIIVTSTGAKSKEISIETSAPMSSLGLVNLPPLRTYPFDLVFGPEADQAMIYHEVVSPMLDEVLMGYNCTLFAYGQTGTGKTHTMQGDLNPTPMGNPSTNAGMIPRVLFRLFHYLETSKMDFSVKISYIELYNEELRDLLTNDLSAPTGSTQPMGMSKDSNKNSENGLKIFDDVSKRGVTIQGLEEVAVKDSKDALILLTKGSHRRQIAATKFNDHSSRSHSIFSITVHIKETSAMGEDLLKTGKLNLVDLAGSENIGRSGAENKRAREAGIINQSLLTLGRVINALVDKAQHIPYRESKLTRLLQDSLGGHTKTCIIATISPARSNMEETLSTLDYAIRAKSIRNKPELNQRTTRNSLLKEYIGEIERLKSDLLAAREKNGIFFSEETWNQMAVEQELRVTELEEARKQVRIIETEMRGVREEFEQSIGLLKMREEELRETRKNLLVTEQALEKTEGELDTMKCLLEEEVTIRKAHQDTEGNLNSIATGLKEVAKQGIQDVGRLLEKLERKSATLDENSQTVLNFERTISPIKHLMEQGFDDFLKASFQSTRKAQSEIKDFHEKELVALASCSARIEAQLQHMEEKLGIIKSTETTETETLDIIHTALQETHQTLQIGFRNWGEGLKKSYDDANQRLKQTGLEAFSTIEASLKAITTLVEDISTEHQEYIDAELKQLSGIKILASEVSQNEIKHLKQQNESLLKLLDSERSKSDKARDQLIQRVSTLLGEFGKERDKDLREAVASVQGKNKQAEEDLKSFSDQHVGIVENMETRAAEMSASLKTRRGQSKRKRDGAYKLLNTSNAVFVGELDNMQNFVSESVKSYSKQVQNQVEGLTSSCSDAFEHHERAKRARVGATASIGADTQAEYHQLHQEIASTSKHIENFARQISSEMLGLEGVTNTYQSATSSQLRSISEAVGVLVTQGTQSDRPTGTTPRKRVWEYEDQWDLTENREVLLQAWRERNVSKVNSETFRAEHLPLPDGDNPDDETVTIFPSKFLVNTDFENTPSVVGSPNALSSLSTSSTISGIIPSSQVPLKKAPGHGKGLSSIGTLTDSRNIYTTRGLRKPRQ